MQYGLVQVSLNQIEKEWQSVKNKLAPAAMSSPSTLPPGSPGCCCRSAAASPRGGGRTRSPLAPWLPRVFALPRLAPPLVLLRFQRLTILLVAAVISRARLVELGASVLGLLLLGGGRTCSCSLSGVPYLRGKRQASWLGGSHVYTALINSIIPKSRVGMTCHQPSPSDRDPI